MTSLLLMGLLIGMRHALDADHLAALASLGSKNHSVGYTIRQGVVWGVGHTLTLFLVGSAVILMESAVPRQMAAGLEMAVGVMLVILGVDVLHRLISQRIHFHSHRHNSQCVHFHAHSHAGEARNRHQASSHDHRHAEGFPLRALLVGLMHGLAGSAALTVLTLQTVKSPLMGLFYILLFGVGSIVGMALLSAVIALPLRGLEKRLNWLHNGFQLLVGSATTLLGVWVILQSYGALIDFQVGVT